MNPSPASWRRRLAEALSRHAVRVMPAGLVHWAGAMQRELAYVTDDHAALRWAVGATGTAYRTRLGRLWLLDVAAVRAGGVLLVLFRAFDVALPSLMTAAYRLRAVALTDGLGRMTPGDDYQRLIPLMEAIPGWLHAMLATAAVCYLVAAMYVVARRRTASIVLLAGVAIEIASQALSKPVLAPVGVVVVQNPSVLAAVLLPVVFPLLLAAAAWSGSRRDSRPLGA